MLELTVIEILPDTALATFAGEFGVTIDPLLAPIKRAVEDWQKAPPSPDTEEGREAIRSFAFKLAKSKTALDAAGKAVAADLKRLPKIVDANRARAWDLIEGWQGAVRDPLTKWEEAEATRKQKHLERIRRFQIVADGAVGMDSEGIGNALRVVALMPGDDNFEEYAEEYRIARENALERLRTALAAAEVAEAQAAELAALRAANEAREAQDRAERDRAVREAAARVAEHERQMAELRRAKDESDRRAFQAEQEAERIRQDAARKEREAAEEREAQERQRIAEEARKAEAERERLAARKRWAEIKAQIIEAIASAIPPTSFELDRDARLDIARAVCAAIEGGRIPYVITVG